jgi:hypothetical protein
MTGAKIVIGSKSSIVGSNPSLSATRLFPVLVSPRKIYEMSVFASVYAAFANFPYFPPRTAASVLVAPYPSGFLSTADFS